MSTSPLVSAVQERLRQARYTDLLTPFGIAGVDFSFTAAMRGSEGRALDLVLIFDTTTGDFGDKDAARVRQRVEALSRALDVTGSRYVVTAVLAGAALATGIEALAEICRVLQIESVPLDAAGHPADELAEAQLDDQIRILLPLTLPPDATGADDGSGPAMEQLVKALATEADTKMVEALIAASSEGGESVTNAIGDAIDAAFNGDDKEEAP